MLFDEINKTIYTDKFFKINDIEDTKFLIFILIIIFFSLKFIIDSPNKIYAIIIIILVYCFIFYIINESLKTNVRLSNKKIDVDKIINDINTGDIVLFRCYEIDKLTGLFNYFLAIIQETFFTHIGIIYKDKSGKVYILESNADEHYCELSKKRKQGVCLIDFKKRIKINNTHRIHLIKNNIHKFIDNDNFYKSILKYKDLSFMENGVYCLNLITNILEEHGIMKEKKFIPYLFDELYLKNNYKKSIEFEKPIIIKEYEL